MKKSFSPWLRGHNLNPFLGTIFVVTPNLIFLYFLLISSRFLFSPEICFELILFLLGHFKYRFNILFPCKYQNTNVQLPKKKDSRNPEVLVQVTIEHVSGYCKQDESDGHWPLFKLTRVILFIRGKFSAWNSRHAFFYVRREIPFTAEIEVQIRHIISRSFVA